MKDPRPALSDEDRALFRTATTTVRPLADDRVEPHRSRPAPRPKAPEPTPDPGPGFPDSTWAPRLEAGDVLSYARPGVQNRLLRRLRRGQIRPEAELDLHGLFSADAERMLRRFLDGCRARGLRCVRVVHGKGRSSGAPVLKSHVDRWLRLRDEVVAFCSTIPPDGGTGAVYVLLKRAG